MSGEDSWERVPCEAVLFVRPAMTNTVLYINFSDVDFVAVWMVLVCLFILVCVFCVVYLCGQRWYCCQGAQRPNNSNWGLQYECKCRQLRDEISLSPPSLSLFVVGIPCIVLYYLSIHTTYPHTLSLLPTTEFTDQRPEVARSQDASLEKKHDAQRRLFQPNSAPSVDENRRPEKPPPSIGQLRERGAPLISANHHS
jgi:hypothetical protein